MKYSFKKFFFAASIFLFLFDFSSCVIEPRPCKITYKSSYGNPPKTKKIPINTILTEEELPELFSEDYTFEGWYDGEVKAEPGVYKITTNVCFVAKWEKIPTFEYKVYHWQENLEDNEYSLYKTETLYGKADYLTQATAFNYEGFTSQEFEQKTITDDNKTEINIYYDRKIITLTFNSNGGSSVSSVTGKYGATVTKVETPIKEGYTFVDWQPTLPKTFPAQDTTYKARWILESDYLITYNLDGGENSLENPISFNIETDTIILKKPTKQGYTFTGWINEDGVTVTKIPKGTTGNITLTATWTPNSNTEYIVEYYCQNIENNEYTLVDVDAKTGTTDSLTEAEIKEFVGFHTPEVEQQTINADGSTLIQIFYERKIITLTFVNEEGVVFDTLEGKYGAPITIEVPSNSDYTFVKWQETPPETFPAENQSYTAIWILTDLISTAETVADDILSLQGEGPHDIVLVGEISYETMQTIVEAMRTNVNAKVNLDLSWATGLSVFPANYFSTCNIGTLILPETITSIEGRFQSNKNLQSITIPENVNYFDAYIFAGCTQLNEIIVDPDNQYYSSSDDRKILLNKDKTSIHSYPSASGDITIPNYISSIGIGAFSQSENLENIIIPNSVTDIGYEAFFGCTNLESVQLPDTISTIEMRTFFDCEKLTNIEIPDTVTSIEQGAFVRCYSLTNIEIPDRVTSIGEQAFLGCSGLTNITIPNSVTSIGYGAFSDCSSLTNIEIPDSVTSLGNELFNYCTSLESVTLPDSITSISPYTFYYCNNLRDISIPESVKTIGHQAFEGCSSLTNITIPESVETIEYNAFSYSGLTSIELSESITSIESYTFAWCYNLTDVTIPDGITLIGLGAFQECHALTNINLPDSVTTIESNAFNNCYNLESVNIPNNVTYIGSNAFYGCKISEVTLPDTISTIGYQAYLSCYNLTTINIPASVTSIESAAFQGCTNLTTFYVDPNNQYYSSSDDKKILYNKDKTYLLSYPSAEGEISIPSTVEIIGDGAFAQSSITKVELPNSITSIGNSAFEKCSSLTEINIPNGVTSIGYSAFSGVSSLQNMEISGSVTSIPNNLFWGCSNLQSVTLPSNLETIDYAAFAYCYELQNITIPASVREINTSAFRRCDKLLFDVETNNNYYSNSTDGTMLLDKDKTTLLTYPSASGDVEITENITHIGDSAFEQCTNLNSIKLPDSVTTIGYNAFNECPNLITVELSNNLTTIKEYSFRCCYALTNIILPDGLVNIEPYAFIYCNSLENITIPASVTKIGTHAFYDCYNLQTVTFEDTNDWYYTYNSDYSNGSEIDVTDEYQNASYLRFNYEWNWYKGVGF